VSEHVGFNVPLDTKQIYNRYKYSDGGMPMYMAFPPIIAA